MDLIWISLLTSTLCLIYVGSSFYKSAWNAAIHRTTNIDTLIAMGASVAYFYSLVFFIGGFLKIWPPPQGDQLYFHGIVRPAGAHQPGALARSQCQAVGGERNSGVAEYRAGDGAGFD